MGPNPIPGSMVNMTNQEALNIGIKLRESCDSCLTAKVKCGKGRPVCHRCLTNGSECQYSPSARAGRKHRNNGVSKPPPRKRPASIEIPSNAPGPSGPCASSWTPQLMQYHQDHPMLDGENNTSIDHHNAQVFSSNTPPLTHEDQKSEEVRRDNKIPVTHASGGNGFDFQVPTPPFSGHFVDPFSQCPEPLSASSGASFPDFNSTVPSPTAGMPQMMEPEAWMANDRAYGMLPDHFPGPLDIISFDDTTPLQPPFGPNPFDKAPIDIDDALPQLRGGGDAASTSHQTQQNADGSQNCDDCFATCLNALHSLHAHSWKTPAATQGVLPFDVILTINREAVRGCHAMMNCTNCSTKSGRPVSTMLLGTVFGKVMSLYRAAVHNRLRPSNDAQLAFGAYTVLAEDKYLLETEILLFELKKVQRTITLFQAKCRDSGTDEDTNGVYEPQAAYLASQLSHIIDFLRSQKEHRAGNA